ncbi:MAG: hypothetical protein ABJA70_06440 [Chryseolinea sp.]
MSISDVRYHIQKVTRRYMAMRSIEILLSAFSVALVLYSFGSLLPLSRFVLVMTCLLAAALFAYFRLRALNLFNISNNDVVRFINRQHPELQESGELLLRDDNDLTTLQKLQQLRSAKHFETLYPTLKLPSQLGTTLITFVISIGLSLALAYVSKLKLENPRSTAGQTKDSQTQENVPAGINKVFVEIEPPKYTRLGAQKITSFTLNIAEGSSVSWKLNFTEPVKGANIILYGRDTVAMQEQGQMYSASKRINQTGFYQVSWTNVDGSKKYSDYFQIIVIRDQPPIVKVDNLEQFIQLSANDNLKVSMMSTLADDYGLKDAYVIATVSKGSGESVKFREEKLKFNNPLNIQGKAIIASLLLDLKKLGLDPGDELYFYVEATDIKVPKFNKSRTETFFIAIKDTAEMTTSVDPGLGVDLLPEYFRSQRQIIIDTEKLLKDKSKIDKKEFNSKSNELGYDEKILRLRYGEFLGEEFETSIGPHAGPPSDADVNQDVTKVYGHQHDTEKEHEAVVETSHSHSHADNNSSNKNDKADPSKEYMHVHDSEEEASFFTMSIRAKLKAAVSIMWDAELHLRMFEPQKSLPFQYKALKLLKEISQDSRVYVHRTGFDPPPLKEEKRLTGELTELKTSEMSKDQKDQENYPAIRKALAVIEANNNSDGIIVTPEIKSILLKAGNELSGAALQQPGRYLKSLSLLKSVSEGEVKEAQMSGALQSIRSTFYSLLPAEASSPQVRRKSVHVMEDQFLENLTKNSKGTEK